MKTSSDKVVSPECISCHIKAREAKFHVRFDPMNNSHTIIDNDHQCTIVVSEENSHHPKKIIDLKNDCLAKIFGYLNLQSLFNVARANEWLRPAAASVYDRKYGDIKISINSCDNYYEPKCNEHLEKDLDDGLEEALKVDI